jgi:hypothetical protein
MRNMQCRYAKRLDLAFLSEKITRFFEDKAFEVIVEHDQFKVSILVKPKKSMLNQHVVNVTLQRGDGFVNVIFEGAGDSAVSRMPALFSLFGGGFLTLKKIKFIEALDRLEREFWDYVDVVVNAC